MLRLDRQRPSQPRRRPLPATGYPAKAWQPLVQSKQRIQRLTAAGRLAPAGLAAVTDAKADGSWTALDAVEELVEPEDLGAALDAEPNARANWDGFPGSTKRAILEWIIAAKCPPTRASRVAETARLAAQGIRANQWRQPGRP